MKKKIISLLMAALILVSGAISTYAQIPNADIQDTMEQSTTELSSEDELSVSENEVSDIEEAELVEDDTAEGEDILSVMTVSENEDIDLQVVDQSVAAGHSFGAATSIKVNTNVTDRINDNYDANYYKFTISKAGVVQVNFSHPVFESNYGYWRIYLYDINQDELVYFISSDGYTASKNSRQIGLPAGTYYLRILTYSYDDYAKGTYTFQIKYTASDNWEKEFNNGWLTATTVQTNQNYCGSCEDDDVDYYKFTISKAGVVQINFSHPIFESDYGYWRIYLYDINQDELVYFISSDGYTASQSSRQIGLPAGTYYLRILTYSYDDYAKSTYTFQIKYTVSDNWEKEFNNGWLTATTVQTNQKYRGSCEADDVDYYKFAISKAGVVQINFAHPIFGSSYNYWRIYLYDAKHNEIMYFYSSDGYTASKKSEVKVLPAGTYYLCILTYNYDDYAKNTYNFSINVQPSPGVTAQVGNVTYKVTKSGASSEVTLVGVIDKKAKSISIPDTVAVNGFVFKVTAIQSNAFKDCKNLTSVTIGKGIKKIGSKAFYGCKKLKKIKVKTTVLKSVGKKAFKGIHKKAVIKVPKKKLAAYKKLMKKKGQAGSVKIKK